MISISKEINTYNLIQVSVWVSGALRICGWVILAGVASSLTVVDRDVAVLAPTTLPLGCLTFQRES